MENEEEGFGKDVDVENPLVDDGVEKEKACVVDDEGVEKLKPPDIFFLIFLRLQIERSKFVC